ncbi:hypothetical protein [Nesterenkonia sp. K-15-9-6]|uniref:hypothetical protein n=1 Tax=Nesterenkonia sp. K-15-9-6 TaxID=3093918 RepID=UPI0040445FE8
MNEDIIASTRTNSIVRLWHFIKEPRNITITFWIFYAALTIGGTWTLIHPPQSISTYFGDTVATIAVITWPTLWATGGAIGLLVTLQGWWWAERIALVLIAGGAFIYYGSIIEAALAGGGSRSAMLTAVSALFFLVVVRFMLISRADFNPEKA